MGGVGWGDNTVNSVGWYRQRDLNIFGGTSFSGSGDVRAISSFILTFLSFWVTTVTTSTTPSLALSGYIP